ncbi:hypothetical protein F5Y08DRAFT_350145 [Xylaria arbuscula]|nr:hypothetical protein F5Y08DRAFT_350145 [Xylaria arbuscula]
MASLPVLEMDSDNATAPASHPTTPGAGEYMSQILDLASLYKSVGDVAILHQLKELAQKALGQEHLGRRLRLEKEKIVEHLITDRDTHFHLEDAEHASEACKALFFANAQGGAAQLLSPDYLLVLGRKLRRMEPLNIAPRLYRPFIMLFCYMAFAKTTRLEETGVVQRCIMKAYVRAKAIVGEETVAPSPIPMDLADPAAAVVEMKTADMKQCDEIETAMKILQETGLKELDGILGSGSSAGEVQMREAIENVAQAVDPDEAKKAIEEVVRSLYLKSDVKIEKLRRLMQVVREESKSILDLMTQLDTQAEDEGEIPVKNEEEECDQ